MTGWLWQAHRKQLDVGDLAARLETNADALRAVRPCYCPVQMDASDRSSTTVLVPDGPLKELQRRILRRVIRRRGQRRQALAEAMAQVEVSGSSWASVRLDLAPVFAQVTIPRLRRLFKRMGYNVEAADVLSSLCTHAGLLPTGAPTTPRLAALVYARLDLRLAMLARELDAGYSRHHTEAILIFPGFTPSDRLRAALHAAGQVLSEEKQHQPTPRSIRWSEVSREVRRWVGRERLGLAMPGV